MSIDPRTAGVRGEVAEETTRARLDEVCARATSATVGLEQAGRRGRSAMLESMAASLESASEDLVALADAESTLGMQRLSGELTRTCFQLRLFAEVLEEGSYLEAIIDHAAPTPMGPRPDVRRMLRPLGPVAVFGASNFPFAFSVAGGDTASALAAGCPVVVKAHDSHPATSLAVHEALREGARRAAVTTEAVNLVFGQRAGTDLVQHESIRAVGFTGSLRVGRLLFDLANSRPSPIPFYGELGALNTVAVGEHAAAARGPEIGSGLAASFTLGVGQFCTKPGLVLLPAGASGERLIRSLAAAVSEMPAAVMLNARIAESFTDRSRKLSDMAGVRVLATGITEEEAQGGFRATPRLLAVESTALAGLLTEECFGPLLIVAEYASLPELSDLLDRLDPALTFTVHADEDDEPFGRAVLDRAARCVGRVVWNEFPTGVAVNWAMQHGGSYPATTNALHTSVGATAIRRWMHPIAYQGVPEPLLPEELRDAVTSAGDIPRRVDGQLVVPTPTATGSDGLRRQRD